MPKKSKDTLAAMIRALPEFQNAARSYLRILTPKRYRLWQTRGDDYAFDYLFHVRIENALDVVNQRLEDAQEAFLPLPHMMRVLEADPSKRYVTIDDFPPGSETHELWSDGPGNILPLWGLKPWQYSGRQDIDSDWIARGWVMDAHRYWRSVIDLFTQVRDDLEVARIAVERLRRVAVKLWLENRSRRFVQTAAAVTAWVFGPDTRTADSQSRTPVGEDLEGYWVDTYICFDH